MANPGRGKCFLSSGGAAALLLGVSLPALADTAAKLEQARQYYEQAAEQKAGLEKVPEADRLPEQYQKIIDTLKRVYRTSGRSSKADDSLFEIAEIYAAMSRRFGP